MRGRGGGGDLFDWLFKQWLLFPPSRPNQPTPIVLLCLFGVIGFYAVVTDIQNGVSWLLATRSAWFTTEDPKLTRLMSKASSLSNGSSENQKIKDKRLHLRWRPIKSLLASTPARRWSAAKKLGLNKGDYYLAFISLGCSSCDREVLKLSQKSQPARIVAFAVAPSDVVERWQKQLGLKYSVRSLSQQDFDDLGGVVLLPTIVYLRDGIAVGASETADTVE